MGKHPVVLIDTVLRSHRVDPQWTQVKIYLEMYLSFHSHRIDGVY